MAKSEIKVGRRAGMSHAAAQAVVEAVTGPQLSRSVTDEHNRSRVIQAIATLRGDELQVIAIVAERLVTPGRSHGQLTVTPDDPRHFGDEALEEAADGLTYVACALMRAARSPKVRP